MNNRIEVDIHGMTVSEAKLKLEKIISKAPSNVNEIVVVHGYKSGDALLNMVRKGLRNKRIKQRILSMNQGETTLVLKEIS